MGNKHPKSAFEQEIDNCTAVAKKNRKHGVKADDSLNACVQAAMKNRKHWKHDDSDSDSDSDHEEHHHKHHKHRSVLGHASTVVRQA